MRRAWFGGLLVLVVLGAGCGGDDEQAATTGGEATTAADTTTYVGEVEGTDAYIALVSDGQQVQGYVCDSEDVSSWIGGGEVSEGEAELVSRQGDALGEATLSGSEADGEVEIDGEDHAFSAEEASGEAGLYRAAEGEVGQPESVEAGWIVLADGSQRGNTNFVDPTVNDVVTKSAPQLDPRPGERERQRRGQRGQSRAEAGAGVHPADRGELAEARRAMGGGRREP